MANDSMTPKELDRSMDTICAHANYDFVKEAGTALFCQALGDNAGPYLLVMEKWFARLQELWGKPKPHGPPTKAGIDAAKSEMDEGRGAL